MKKIRISRFFKNQRVLTFVFMLGLLFLGNVNTQAQSAANIDLKINNLTTLQATFAPGSAKYDIVDTAIDYLVWVKNNSAANPNYFGDNLAAANYKRSHQIRKTHPSILREYSPTRLAEMQTEFNSMTSNGIDPKPGIDTNRFTKMKWVLEANAY